MNLNYLAKVILGRPTCILGRGVKIGSKARILNARDSSAHIKIGNGSIVRGELCVLPHANGGSITIGERCFIDEGTRIWSGASVDIGNDVIIGPDVNILDTISHPLSAAKRHEQAKLIFNVGHPKDEELGDLPIRIGRGTQIGARSFVLRGVTIGENEVVPPGTLVSKSLR